MPSRTKITSSHSVDRQIIKKVHQKHFSGTRLDVATYVRYKNSRTYSKGSGSYGFTPEMSGYDLLIGCWSGLGYVDGTIDEVRIWDVAFDNGTIAKRYSQGIVTSVFNPQKRRHADGHFGQPLPAQRQSSTCFLHRGQSFGIVIFSG